MTGLFGPYWRMNIHLYVYIQECWVALLWMLTTVQSINLSPPLKKMQAIFFFILSSLRLHSDKFVNSCIYRPPLKK